MRGHERRGLVVVVEKDAIIFTSYSSLFHRLVEPAFPRLIIRKNESSGCGGGSSNQSVEMRRRYAAAAVAATKNRTSFSYEKNKKKKTVFSFLPPT